MTDQIETIKKIKIEDIAHKIISNEANYILALKQNQGSLYDDISPYFTGPSDFQD